MQKQFNHETIATVAKKITEYDLYANRSEQFTQKEIYSMFYAIMGSDHKILIEHDPFTECAFVTSIVHDIRIIFIVDNDQGLQLAEYRKLYSLQ